MKKEKIQKLLVFGEHPLIVSLFSGVIVCIVGACLTNYFTQQNLKRQMQLELYKNLIQQQTEFVDHLSKDIYSRMYRLTSYFSILKGKNYQELQNYWNKYQDETAEWNKELKLYLINLDRYFPKEEFKIINYVIAKELFNNYPKYSFRNVLENIIQKRFVEIHKNIFVLDSEYLNGQKPIEEELASLDTKINNLIKYVYEFTEGLSQASFYYKINTKVKLLKESF